MPCCDIVLRVRYGQVSGDIRSFGTARRTQARPCLSTWARVTVVLLTFSVLAQGGGGVFSLHIVDKMISSVDPNCPPWAHMSLGTHLHAVAHSFRFFAHISSQTGYNRSIKGLRRNSLKDSKKSPTFCCSGADSVSRLQTAKPVCPARLVGVHPPSPLRLVSASRAPCETRHAHPADAADPTVSR